jgi:hypothetical protein
MKRFIGKISIWAMAVVFLLTIPNVVEAREIEVIIEIEYGHKEDINGKIFCVDLGICKARIIIIGLPPPFNRSMSGDFKPFPGSAEVKDETLLIKLSEKLEKKYMYPEGTYTFPVEKDLHIEGKEAEEFGFKKFTIPKGQYKFDGQNLKIRLTKVKPRENVKHPDLMK